MTSTRKISVGVALGAVVALTASTSAMAMTANATPDGDAHPAVVALLFTSAPDTAFAFCSGTLLNERVVVTASHCASAVAGLPTSRVLVTNDPVLTDDPNGRIAVGELDHVSPAAAVVVNPAYKPGVGTDSYREDVSAIVVADPAALGRPGGVTYPALPTAGVLDGLRRAGTLRSTPVQVMGYGTEAAQNGAGGQTFADSNERRGAELSITALDPQVIHESQNRAQGSAGACYGDSGGPTFATIGGRWTILGVTSTGDIPCWSTNTASRLDRASVLDFLTGLG